MKFLSISWCHRGYIEVNWECGVFFVCERLLYRKLAGSNENDRANGVGMAVIV